jgi:hypothetical protein
MNWFQWFATLGCILFFFLLTGAPVTPSLSEYRFNGYDSRSVGYFIVLAWHYFFGAAFVAWTVIGKIPLFIVIQSLLFLYIFGIFVGALRHQFWNDDDKAAAHVWSITFLVASIFTVYGTYKIMPGPNTFNSL